MEFNLPLYFLNYFYSFNKPTPFKKVFRKSTIKPISHFYVNHKANGVAKCLIPIFVQLQSFVHGCFYLIYTDQSNICILTYGKYACTCSLHFPNHREFLSNMYSPTIVITLETAHTERIFGTSCPLCPH